MPATKRKHEPGVIGRLLEEPYKFEFTQLLNVLLSVLRGQGVSYENAFRDVLRFRNSLSLAFPASEVCAIQVEAKDASKEPAAVRALSHGEVKKIRITPAFIGLLGASGTLPLHDTERIAARQSGDGDASQRELVDTFSNRVMGLFYEAWGKYRVEHGIDVRGQDRLLPMLMALAGRRSSAAGRAFLKDETSAHYAGLLRTRPVSAATIEHVLAHHLDVPVRLEQFVGRWEPIPANRRSTLGFTKPVLGLGAAIGTRAWRHDLGARLHIGPLDKDRIKDFLPGGRARHELGELVTLFATPALAYEVRLLLAPPCIERMSLTTHSEPRRLGWTSFLTGTPGETRNPAIGSMLRGTAGPPRST
jgi:type VI secretion system protein ImpH